VRRAIRLGIPGAAIAAAAIGIVLPTPEALPAVALGSRELFWLERALVLFYGILLFFVPILRALQGELPIELSARGTRYAEASASALEELKARVDEKAELLDRTIQSVESIAMKGLHSE
jgi:hypothetical protein